MLRNLINQQIRSILGRTKSPAEFLYPPGDPGLFGPNSMVWLVHQDFISMMIGGISSLILQALHPLALAGVWDHSSFREDLQGRLGRTAYFIAVTTYGNTEMANQIITRVKKIHDTLHGFHPDGRPYSVSDPHLLYWVHLTEATSFLNAYQNFVNPFIKSHEMDQYLQEMAKITEKLGCHFHVYDKNFPFALNYKDALLAIERYFPELDYSDRSREVIDLLENFPSPKGTELLSQLIIKAGFYNLPDWAYPLIGRKAPSQLEKTLLNNSIRLVAKPIRWAMKDGIAGHARRRMGIFI